jgi:predicted O-methyltransferase YrrM
MNHKPHPKIDFKIHLLHEILERNDLLSHQKLEIRNLLLYLEYLRKNGLKRCIPNISEQTACVILQLLYIHKAQNILEIGCANGYSSLYWAAYCKYLAPQNTCEINKLAHLCTIDISAPMVKETIDHLLAQKLHLQTEVYWGDALNILPRLNCQFDAVFIDAQKAKTAEILKLCLKLMTSKSLFVIDDVIKFSNKMHDLFDFLKEKNINYEIIQTDEDDGILWGII